MRRLVTRASLAAALLGVASTLQGQSRTQDERPGWIGISYEMRSSVRRPGSTVVITDVSRGSPAETAGIRPGDRLVAIGDLSEAEELMSLPRRALLSAGQIVAMRIERDGRRMEIRVRAAERPATAYVGAVVDLSRRTDSMVETMVRAMDSLRISLTGTDERIVSRVSTRQLPAVEPFPRGSANGPTGVSAPFEFFVFRGEQYDSLVREMEGLNRRLGRLRERERERAEELRRQVRGSRVQTQDRRLADLREAIEEVTRESASLRQAMAEAARATAGWEYMLATGREASPEPSEPEASPFRPLAPYLLGSNRVAGAQVIEVQPELGAYFGVDRGVLVVDVSPGTPAAIAGLRPGDVVTRLDQVGVRTVEELRFGVAQAGDTLPVTLVRRGESVQVLLRRR